MRISKRDLKRLIENYVNETPLGMRGINISFDGNTTQEDPWDFENIGEFHKSPEKKAASTFLSAVQTVLDNEEFESEELNNSDGDDYQYQHQGQFDPVSVMFISPIKLAILVGPEGEPEKIKSMFSKLPSGEMHNLKGDAGLIYDEILSVAKKGRGIHFDKSSKAKGTITGRGQTALFVMQD